MGTKFGLLTAQEAHARGYVPAQIFIDGVRVRDVETVNDIEGWADILQFDKYIESMDAVPTERHYGDILYIPACGDLKL